MKNVILAFDNNTSGNVHALSVDPSAVDYIIEWYVSHYSGGDVSVTIDGVVQVTEFF